MDLHTIIEGLDYVSQTANKSSIMMKNVAVLLLELLVIFIIRFIILLRMNNTNLLSKKAEDRKKRTLIENHLGFEISIAILLGWFVMMVFSSVEINYIINLIISPLVGSLGGITVDNVYILPRRNNSLYSLSVDTPKSKVDSKDEEPIVININNPSNISQGNVQKSPPVTLAKRLPQDLSDSSEFNVTIIDTINDMQIVQGSHELRLTEVCQKCSDISQWVQDIREAEMLERKMWLKGEMYRCLSNGFATPEEYDKIRSAYHAYHNLLKGNGDVEHLYQARFVHISVHEDRRKHQQDFTGADRRTGAKCKYGEYDSEYKHGDKTDTLNKNE